ncbi:expressed unknown protein [Seminavis robusta]|uniref:Uncharacterized protein n=1 Tax=Seminavis robusta TaxID=568900 RepID=A0A9N8E718_9STRA|nr:expressed unknown protein [Seminavis robusta]|eukprot:Sro691_g187840.1 n/a (213) ;mRNA; r:22386-23024
MAAPVMINVCCVFVFSSLLHLIPWKNKRLQDAITRLDKSCILALCVTAMFVTPQLVESETCKPGAFYSLVTAAIPLGLAFIGILCGLGPIAFASFICPFASNLWFYGVHVEDSEVFYCMLGGGILHALGFSLYASRAGGYHPFWGYHEWFHLFVTIGILVQVEGVFALSSYTDEICTSGGSDTESIVGILTEEIYTAESAATALRGMFRLVQ